VGAHHLDDGTVTGSWFSCFVNSGNCRRVSTDLAAIAVIGVGVILLFQGANVVLRYSELLYEAGASSKVHPAVSQSG
jgi:hypothetical protein